MQELHGIQNLFENLSEIDENIQKLNSSIDEKKNLIVNAEESIEKIHEEQNSFQNEINALISQKEKFWEISENIQKQIEEKNIELEDTMDRLRALENVMRIINSIEDIKKENIDAKNDVETCLKNVDELNSEVNKVQIKFYPIILIHRTYDVDPSSISRILSLRIAAFS